MTQLSDDQQSLRSSIKRNAIVWGLVLGLIIAGLAYWISSNPIIAAGGGLLCAAGLYKKFMSSGAKGAKCAKCNAGFSVSRTDKTETLIKSEARESRKELENGDTEITTWVEEMFDVDDTYSCSKCDDTTHKTYQSTRKRDEETVVKSSAKKSAENSGTNSQGKSKKSKGNTQRKP